MSSPGASPAQAGGGVWIAPSRWMGLFALLPLPAWAGAFAAFWFGKPEGPLLGAAALGLATILGVADSRRRFGSFALPSFALAVAAGAFAALAVAGLAGGWSALAAGLGDLAARLAPLLPATLFGALLSRFWLPDDDLDGVSVGRAAMAGGLALAVSAPFWVGAAVPEALAGMAAALAFAAALESCWSSERMNLPASALELSIPGTQFAFLALLPLVHPLAKAAGWNALAAVAAVGFAQLTTAYLAALCPRRSPAI